MKIHSKNVTDMPVLFSLKNLWGLNASGGSIEEESGLDGSETAEKPDLSDNHVVGISAPGVFNTIRIADLSEKRIRDISALQGKQALFWLKLNDSRIENFGPIIGRKFVKLGADGNPGYIPGFTACFRRI